MQTKPVWIALVAVGTVSALAWAFITYADDQVRPIPDRIEEDKAPNHSLFMQAKMSASQRVLEGLLNREFDTIETAAKTLGELADSVPNPEAEHQQERIFDHFRVEFMRQSNHLQKMAAARNLEGAAFVYQNMTSTCIACHQHLRDMGQPLPAQPSDGVAPASSKSLRQGNRSTLEQPSR